MEATNVMDKEKRQLKIAIISLIVLSLFQFINSCTTSSKVKSLTKTVKELDSAVVVLKVRPAPLTEAQVRDAVKDECMETMYKYLIYETDLDKGKTSLSQIRSDVDRVKQGN